MGFNSGFKGLIYIPGIRADFEIMWKKYGTVRQVTDDNIKQRMRFVCWMTKGIDTHSEYIRHSFSTATMVTRTCLSVTLQVNFLCCFLCFGFSPGAANLELPHVFGNRNKNLPEQSCYATLGVNDPGFERRQRQVILKRI